MSYGADIHQLSAMSEAAKVGRLEGIIADALAALDDGRLGDVRRILKTGKAGPVLASTGVLAKGQG